jgi:ABC-type protease/lipase transport system fused ATPase/permease subunit
MANILVRAASRYSTRAQSRIVERLRKSGATKPANALEFIASGRSEKRLLERMVTFGAVVETEGRLWLDEQALVHFRKEELARMLGAIAVAGFAAAGAIALGR